MFSGCSRTCLEDMATLALWWFGQQIFQTCRSSWAGGESVVILSKPLCCWLLFIEELHSCVFQTPHKECRVLLCFSFVVFKPPLAASRSKSSPLCSSRMVPWIRKSVQSLRNLLSEISWNTGEQQKSEIWGFFFGVSNPFSYHLWSLSGLFVQTQNEGDHQPQTQHCLQSGIGLCSAEPDRVIHDMSRGSKVGQPKQQETSRWLRGDCKSPGSIIGGIV